MGVAAIWSCDLVDLYKFPSPFRIRLHIKLASIGKAVLQKKMFENCGRWTIMVIRAFICELSVRDCRLHVESM